jgi:hypothetical protein
MSESDYEGLLPEEAGSSEPPDAKAEEPSLSVEPPADSQELTVSEELPPTPEEAKLWDMPLAERETHKLAQMTPERAAAYAKATGQILSHPAVAAFKEEEDRAREAKKLNQEAFLTAYRKKQKEKS